MTCFDLNAVAYFRGKELRIAPEVITRQLCHPAVKITGLNDATLPQRHLSQIHLRKLSVPSVRMERKFRRSTSRQERF